MGLRYWKITANPEVKKTGRNAPCPCGSKKKYKKCCQEKKKQHTMSVVLDFGRPVDVNEVIFDRYENRFRFFSPYGELIPNNASFETSSQSL